MEQNRNQFISIPSAIIVAGAIVAVAIIWTQKPAVQNNSQYAAVNQPTVNIAPITSADHIFGDPNAPIKLVEYSDISCPFCKMFHSTMNKIIQEYGPSGQVAWVYRHYPLNKPDQEGRVLHPNAGKEAEATECAASLGGNDKFWAYTNKLYEITPSVTSASPQGLDQNQLPEIARTVGLDVASFKECLASGRFKTRVERDALDGFNAGVNGTPHTVVITPSGSKIPITGAQPYAAVKTIIDTILTEIN